MTRNLACSSRFSLLLLASPVLALTACTGGDPQQPFGTTGNYGDNSTTGVATTDTGVGASSGGATGVVGAGGQGVGTGSSGGVPNGGGSGGGVTTGSGGSGGDFEPNSICMLSDPNSQNSEFIDNMEGVTGIKGGTLRGSWYASNDGSVQQTPESGSFARGAGLDGPGAGGTMYALHSTANVPGGADWGATVQLDFGQVVNASRWQGVRFWAKGSGNVRLNLVTQGTLPSDAGGTCNGECYDSHGTKVGLNSDWNEVKVYFSDLRQEGFGTAIDFDPATILAIALQTKDPGSYDFWIDEMEFFSEEGMPDCANYPGDSRCEPTQDYCSECSHDPKCECLLMTCVETGVLEGPLACNQQVTNQRNGGSTRYWISQASSDRDTSGGYEALGCGIPVISKGNDQGSAASQDRVLGAPGGGTLFGALNSADYGEGAGLCGACVLVNDKVTIQIVDECPNRPGAQGNPVCTSGHIDLSVAAAQQVGGDNPSISWKVVPCENAAPEYIWHWDTTNFWGALSIVGLKYPAAKVELKDGSSWIEGKRKPYWGAWIFGQDPEAPGSSGSVPPPPWTVRITDIHGQVIQDKFTNQGGPVPNPVQNGTVVPYPSLGAIQLPVCGM